MYKLCCSGNEDLVLQKTDQPLNHCDANNNEILSVPTTWAISSNYSDFMSTSTAKMAASQNGMQNVEYQGSNCKPLNNWETGKTAYGQGVVQDKIGLGAPMSDSQNNEGCESMYQWPFSNVVTPQMVAPRSKTPEMFKSMASANDILYGQEDRDSDYLVNEEGNCFKPTS